MKVTAGQRGLRVAHVLQRRPSSGNEGTGTVGR